MSTTTTYKNVLLLGATGATGKHIFAALLADSTFNVTVLSRATSNATFPSNVKVIKVDYSDKAALTKALVGQDIVISTVGGEGVLDNFGLTLVEAAINAGVKWFFPSEFGGDYDDPILVTTPSFASKVAVAKLLRDNQSRINHTIISPGAFLDSTFDNGFIGFDISNRTITLYDEGKARISGTTLPNMAKAVVTALHHPELALNKRILIANTTFTQQEALALFENETDTKWTVKHISTQDIYKQATEKLAQGKTEEAFYDYIRYLLYSGQKVFNFEGRTNNKEFGISTIPLEQVVKEALQRAKANQH